MVIAIFNPKGGCGKTTTAVNVAAVLAHSGKSVLLVDLEADLNASISLGVRPTDARPSIADILLHRERPSDAVQAVDRVPGLSLISGSSELVQMDTALRNVRQPERRLADVIGPLASKFEVIVLDAPSGFSLLALSVPIAAQHLIVPIRAEYLALESLAQFLQWYGDRPAARQPPARMAGILLTMVDYRRQATREIVDIIQLHNQRGVFRTEIPEDPRVAEAPSHGVPLVDYAARSRGSSAYQRFTTELLKRVNQRT